MIFLLLLFGFLLLDIRHCFRIEVISTGDMTGQYDPINSVTGEPCLNLSAPGAENCVNGLAQIRQYANDLIALGDRDVVFMDAGRAYGGGTLWALGLVDELRAITAASGFTAIALSETDAVPYADNLAFALNGSGVPLVASNFELNPPLSGNPFSGVLVSHVLLDLPVSGQRLAVVSVPRLDLIALIPQGDAFFTPEFYGFTDVAPVLQEAVGRVLNLGATVVVALLPYDVPDVSPYQALVGLDVLLATGGAAPPPGVLLPAAGAGALAACWPQSGDLLGFCRLSLDFDSFGVARNTSLGAGALNASAAARDGAVAAALDGARARVAAARAQPLGALTRALPNAGVLQCREAGCPCGAFFADAFAWAARNDTRGGGAAGAVFTARVDAALPAGVVTRGDVLDSLPFAPTLEMEVAELNGSTVLAMLEVGASLIEVPAGPGVQKGRFLQPSRALSWRVNLNVTAFEGRVSDARVDGAPLDPQQVYRLVVNHIVLDGLAGYGLAGLPGAVLSRTPLFTALEITERYFAAFGTVAPDNSTRIFIENRYVPPAPPPTSSSTSTSTTGSTAVMLAGPGSGGSSGGGGSGDGTVGAAVGGTVGGVSLLLLAVLCCCAGGFFLLLLLAMAAAALVFLVLLAAGGALLLVFAVVIGRQRSAVRRALLLQGRRGGGGGDSQLLRIPLEDLEMGERLGLGAYGAVYVARWRSSNVAVKVFSSETGHWTEKQREMFVHETRLMAQLRHPHIVTLMAVAESEAQLALVMELCTGGSLFNFLQDPENDDLAETQIFEIARQIASGMAFMHDVGVVHRDLKSMNILLTEGGTAKVTDFGISKGSGPFELLHISSPSGGAPSDRGEDDDEEMSSFSGSVGALFVQKVRALLPARSKSAEDDSAGGGAGTTKSSTSGPSDEPHWTKTLGGNGTNNDSALLGTLLWMAPEVIRGTKATFSSDVYSFGVVLWEMITRRVPYDHIDTGKILSHLKAGKEVAPLKIPRMTPRFYKDLIRRCWSLDSAERPSFAELKEIFEQDPKVLFRKRKH